MNTGVKQIAIIPARGGSKRLKRKNILPICGKPMLSYPINTALKSGLFDEVVVSTEDDEIAQAATDAGAATIRRPDKLAQDRSTVVQVCSHILSLPEYDKVESFCCIYPTAILITSQDLLDSRKLMDEQPGADFVMGVSHYNYHPVQALSEHNGFLRSMWPEYQGVQSQFYPDLVVSNGTFYWAAKKVFVTAPSFYGKRLRGFLIPPNRAVDIDTLEDYEKAKSLLSDPSSMVV